MAASSKLWPAKGSWWLPFEVVEEILCRTPMESLIRFKPTCKEWYALLYDKRFIYKHLDLSQERFIRIYDDMVQIINPVTLDLLCLPVPAEFCFGYHNIVLDIIHCDGLLLCHCARDGVMLAVWNPVLSRIKWIEPPEHPHHPLDVYGFGYDRDSYKILSFNDCEGTKFEIYDFKSKLWRAFPATFDWLAFMPLQHVSMKGNMYWIAETKSNKEIFIQSFDFSRETFKPICSFPIKVESDYTRFLLLDMVALSGFRGDRLSLLHQRVGDETRKIELWITNKVTTDGAVSWSKYFNVTLPHLPILHPKRYSTGNPTYFIHKTNCITLWCDEVVQGQDYACDSCYEIGEGEIKKHVETSIRGRDSCICGHVYVPSLVPVPE